MSPLRYHLTKGGPRCQRAPSCLLEKPRSGLQEVLQRLLDANPPIQLAIGPGESLGRVPVGVLVEDEESGHRLPKVFLQRPFGPEDGALRRGGAGHRGVVGHERGRLLRSVLDLDGDPLLLQLLEKVEGLLVVEAELSPGLLFTTVVKLYIHRDDLLKHHARHSGRLLVILPPRSPTLWYLITPRP